MRDVSTHASLLARLRDPYDVAAIEAFDARYREVLFRFARGRGLQPADADDVAQETLAAAHATFRDVAYDPSRGSFRGWLKTAAVRAVGKLRRPSADALDRGVEASAALDSAEADAEMERAFDAEWRRHHLQVAAARARDEFGADAMRLFEALAFDGRPAADVAAEARMSVDALYKLKSRIVARVRAFVAEQTAEEG
jgi:RNA polymerase sigma factor (sigma-70 family)